MCQNILTPLTYWNSEEIFQIDLACRMNEFAWPPQKNNTLRICWILYSEIIIVVAHHFPVKSSETQLSESWKREKNMPNVTSIRLLRILCFSPLSLSIHQRKMQMGHMRDELLWSFLKKTIKEFKGCTVQSTISKYAHSYSEEQVYAISDYKEQVDAIINSE